jgi:hypothetical protein
MAISSAHLGKHWQCSFCWCWSACRWFRLLVTGITGHCSFFSQVFCHYYPDFWYDSGVFCGYCSNP